MAVSIVALLVAILLPAMERAREAAYVAVCASQERQVMTAAHLYMDDHDGRVPAPVRNRNVASYVVWSNDYGGWVYDGLLVKHGYLDDGEVLICPGMDPRPKK